MFPCLATLVGVAPSVDDALIRKASEILSAANMVGVVTMKHVEYYSATRRAMRRAMRLGTLVHGMIAPCTARN